MKSDRLSQKQVDFLDALEKTSGVVTQASKLTAISLRSHYNWLKNNESYRERVEVLTSKRVDFAETKLLENVKENKQGAIEYYLDAHGKDRGYGTGQTGQEYKIVNFSNKDQELVIDAILSYTDLNDVLLLLNMEQYQFVKFINGNKKFKEGVKQQISKMLFCANAKDGGGNNKALILRRWLNVLSDEIVFNTATMMYIGILEEADEFTFNDDFWKSPEGIKVALSLREYIINKKDYMLFCRLYFKRVLKKELVLLPYHGILAKFYMLVHAGDRKRFICNLPVRHGKTEFINALIFFFFLIDPSSIILHSAYGDTPLKTMRNRIEVALNTDPFFMSIMQLQTPALRFNTTDFITTKNGNYLQFTINGQVTGRGGNALDATESGALLLDDVNAPKWKGTQHMINSNEIVINTLLSRIPHLAMLNTQQRIDEGDLTGYLLERSNTSPPGDDRYRFLVCYIPFDKNKDTDNYYKELKRKYPNVDFYGYEELEAGVINPSMAHYARKDTCPEAWHIYLTQYQQIPTESADKLFYNDMFVELKMNEIGVDATTGHLLYLDRRPDGSILSMLLTLFFHIDTSQLSDSTQDSDYTVISLIGVGVDQEADLKRAILFEQIQKSDIGIKDFERLFSKIATKWLSIFPKNDIILAVEEKVAGSVAKTTCEDIIHKLIPQYNVQSSMSLELKRPSGEPKRTRGEQASQLLERESWFRYYPYNLATGLDSRFSRHGNIKTVDPDHWWHETRYELINFTGRNSSTIKDDCCEGLFDVANKMIIDGGEWRQYVTYRSKIINEHNLVKA